MEWIEIKHATQNNLKNISVNIPKKQLTVVTGLSGSGKSSLVFDTLAAESRRELNDTFSSFVQNYLPKYGRPEVEKSRIFLLQLSLTRKVAGNSRSTVGTYTDIYTFYVCCFHEQVLHLLVIQILFRLIIRMENVQHAMA